MKAFLFSILIFGFSNEVLGGQIDGSESPQFQQAVRQWLENDDRKSLPALAVLAKEGNIAARLLLARIERTNRAPSPYLESLSKKDWLSLFRAPKEDGKFYSSWLAIEARAGNELASLLQKAGSPHIDLDTIEKLIKFGETEATDHLVRIASLYGNTDVHKRLLNEGLGLEELYPYVLSYKTPPQKLADGVEALRYIAKYSGSDSVNIDVNDQDTDKAVQLLSLGTPFGSVNKSNKWRQVIEYWLLNHASMQPVAEICGEYCSEDKGDCAVTILGLTGGYFEAIRLDSPLESVIPQSVFLQSERARHQALRRAALVRAEDGTEIATLKEIEVASNCLANEIAIHRQSRTYND